MLRNVLGIILAGFIVTVSSVIVLASDVFDNVDIEGIEAYEEIINGLEGSDSRVKIIDMDNDGIPELAVKDAGKEKTGIYIYTLENNKAVKIYDYSDYDIYSSDVSVDIGITRGSNSTVYVVIITGEGGSKPWDGHNFLYKDGNTMKSKINTRYDSADLDAIYMVNNTAVNKNVYDAVMKNYMNYFDRSGNGKIFEYLPKIKMDKIKSASDYINEVKESRTAVS